MLLAKHSSIWESLCPSVCLSSSHTFLVVMHSYVLYATHAFLRMLPLCCIDKHVLCTNLQYLHVYYHANAMDGTRYLVCQMSCLMPWHLSSVIPHTMAWIWTSFEFILDNPQVIWVPGNSQCGCSDAKPKRRHGAAYLTYTKTVFFLAKIYDSATNKKGLFYINR